MKIDIWSDIRCPFCYIGKRKFEKALEQFPHGDKVQVVWRSFELDPSLKTNPGTHLYDYLAKVKGMTRDESVRMHDRVKTIAREAGLDFNFEGAVVANSFNAHRLIQLAKTKELGNQAEEALFRAHFTDGKNIDDPQTLLELGTGIGLDRSEVSELLRTDKFASEVKQDQAMARSIGIRGVPFFVFNEKFAVSGAQAPEFFLQTLHKAWEDQVKVST